MPQGWEENWPLCGIDGKPLRVRSSSWRLPSDGRVSTASATSRSSRSPSTPRCPTAPGRTKRKALNAHSKLLLNARLAEHETWDEQAIDEHGAWLADRLVSIWPGPASENSTTWPGPTPESWTTKPEPAIRDLNHNAADGQPTDREPYPVQTELRAERPGQRP